MRHDLRAGMKVLMLSKYERSGASSRLRFYQYLPHLREAGIEVTIAPLFSEAYVQHLQQGVRKPWEVLVAYAGRLRALWTAGQFDLIWLEKELLPWLPAWLERLLLSRQVPYVLDYDDAVFHLYDHHRRPMIRWALEGKHPELMKHAALVVAGNSYLAEFAIQAGASRVVEIPTVIDLDRYPVRSERRAQIASPCIGWIGQWATAPFLLPFKGIFEALEAAGQASFTAIGIDAQSWGLPMRSVAWSEHTEVQRISELDIGIMPLQDGLFERGKCGYKLIQYMACGLPVVASPVGVNARIIEHGVNGFLAESLDQWREALSSLLQDLHLRERMGQAGRLKVEQQYSLQVTAPLLSGLLWECGTSRKNRSRGF